MYIYLLEFTASGAYEEFPDFLSMLKEIKQLRKIGMRKYTDYTWTRVEKKPETTKTECMSFDEF